MNSLMQDYKSEQTIVKDTSIDCPFHKLAADAWIEASSLYTGALSCSQSKQISFRL